MTIIFGRLYKMRDLKRAESHIQVAKKNLLFTVTAVIAENALKEINPYDYHGK